MSKTAQIINIILIVVGIIGLLLYVVLSTIFENSYLDILLVFAIPFVIGIVYYILINKNIKKMAENKFINAYTFENDFLNIATIKNGEIVGTQKLYYKDIVKIKENSEYIFIYPNKFNAFIIKKFNVNEEDLKAVRILLNL